MLPTPTLINAIKRESAAESVLITLVIEGTWSSPYIYEVGFFCTSFFGLINLLFLLQLFLCSVILYILAIDNGWMKGMLLAANGVKEH